MSSGATTRASTSLPRKICDPRREFEVAGDGDRLVGDGDAAPQRGAASRPPTMNSCDSPIVATVSSSRGARKNRRMTTYSTRAPSTSAAASPAKNPTK